MAWYYAKKRDEPAGALPASFPLLNEIQTPSQKATVKYFWIVLPYYRAGADGRDNRPLQCGRPGILWYSAFTVVSVFCFPNLAYPDRHILDCYILACYRAILCPGHFGCGTQISTAGSEFPIHSPADYCSRITDWSMDGSYAETRTDHRTSGSDTRGMNTLTWAASGNYFCLLD